MNRTTSRAVKKVLLSMMVVGSLTFFTLAGTYAALNSETANKNATVASGTLVLGNKVASGSTCFSYSATDNSNASCDALFSSAGLNYPGVAATVDVTITNNGTVPASSLAVYMPSCTTVASPGAPSPGGGDMCATGGPMMYIDESNSSFTSHSCVYPTTGGTCAFSANTLNYLAAVKNGPTSTYPLPGTLAAGASRYFIIGMELPSTAANALQGEAAQFDLTWNVSQ